MSNKLKRGLLECGDKILNGRYEILKVIHASGMSNVYLVLDSNLNKQWCLKEIRKSEAGRNQIEYYSLLQEANIMKGLNHSNIPRITTIEEDGDSIFIVMDYVDGMSMKTYITKYGKVDQDLAIKWMVQVVSVMLYLHSRKNPIFYRDMKPDNIMLQNDGNVKLIDFGISVVIREPGQLITENLGTRGYAAPEQSKTGMPCDLRSDIYAIGKTMYYMLTGINPAQVPKDKLRPIRDLAPSISSGVEAIVTKCIQPNPEMRYQSCEELLYALKNYKLFDSIYINKVKRKIRLSIAPIIIGVILVGLSFIPLLLYNKQQEDKYLKLITIAQQSGKSSDYESVFDLEPLSDNMLYIEYINSLKTDGVFSKEEETILLSYINPNIQEIKENADYGELAYNLGKLYWFYYEGSSDIEGIINSIKWFEDSKNENYEIELSEVYYQLGVFNKDILSSITEAEDVGMYKEYWNNLLKAKEIESGDLLTLQINLYIAKCINVYGYNLKTDGIPYEDMKEQVDLLVSYVNNYTPNTEASLEKYTQLEELLKGLPDKVESLYNEGGAL